MGTWRSTVARFVIGPENGDLIAELDEVMTPPGRRHRLTTAMRLPSPFRAAAFCVAAAAIMRGNRPQARISGWTNRCMGNDRDIGVSINCVGN